MPYTKKQIIHLIILFVVIILYLISIMQALFFIYEIKPSEYMIAKVTYNFIYLTMPLTWLMLVSIQLVLNVITDSPLDKMINSNYQDDLALIVVFGIFSAILIFASIYMFKKIKKM